MYVCIYVYIYIYNIYIYIYYIYYIYYILYIFIYIYIFRTVFKNDKSLKMLLDTNGKIVELYNQRSNELHSKFTFNIHVIAYSFPLLLRSDLRTIQHITVKDILDDNIFY